MRCKHCHEGQVVTGEYRATREMALDAGDPSLEGQIVDWQYDQCSCCDGNWQECPVCGYKSFTPRSTTAIREEMGRLLHLRENEPDEDDTWNNLQREFIEAYALEHDGQCYLGKVNLYPTDPDKDIMWPYKANTGQMVYNFGAAFVVPVFDEELESMIANRALTEYTGTKDDMVRVEAIFEHIEKIGGHGLLWN